MAFKDKKKQARWITSYNKAMSILSKRHPEEFKKIFDKLLEEYDVSVVKPEGEEGE